MVKSDEIYRQKPINKQNYGFSQKLILYICTQTINTSHYGTEKDRTYNIASDCFWYNCNHGVLAVRPYFTMVGTSSAATLFL